MPEVQGHYSPQRVLRQKLEEAMAKLHVQAEGQKLLGNPRNLKEEFHYMWVNPENISTWMHRGAEVVKSKVKKEHGRNVSDDETTDGLQNDGTHTYGGQTLMREPLEKYEERQWATAARSTAQLKGSREGVLRKAREMGIPASVEE